MNVAAVVIGRNEGARLIACLEALQGAVSQVIYVDSGSTDGSIEAAKIRGARVISLDMTEPFTAARARNAGIAALSKDTTYVQFLDGDCALRSGWIEAATKYLDENPKTAVVCGRRRERFPDASIYNGLIDTEWDTPIGAIKACGGDALMRAHALIQAGGYRDHLIAGEEPELCVRLRAAGWGIWRLDHEMTWHDADIHRFGQWWQRSRRAGHAFAEGAALHGAPPEYHWVKETRRALLWGGALPTTVLALTLFLTPWALILLAIYPAQFAYLTKHGGKEWALFTTLAKFPECLGALQFYLRRITNRKAQLIEYK